MGNNRHEGHRPGPFDTPASSVRSKKSSSKKSKGKHHASREANVKTPNPSPRSEVESELFVTQDESTAEPSSGKTRHRVARPSVETSTPSKSEKKKKKHRKSNPNPEAANLLFSGTADDISAHHPGTRADHPENTRHNQSASTILQQASSDRIERAPNTNHHAQSRHQVSEIHEPRQSLLDLQPCQRDIYLQTKIESSSTYQNPYFEKKSVHKQAGETRNGRQIDSYRPNYPTPATMQQLKAREVSVPRNLCTCKGVPAQYSRETRSVPQKYWFHDDRTAYEAHLREIVGCKGHPQGVINESKRLVSEIDHIARQNQRPLSTAPAYRYAGYPPVLKGIEGPHHLTAIQPHREPSLNAGSVLSKTNLQAPVSRASLPTASDRALKGRDVNIIAHDRATNTFIKQEKENIEAILPTNQTRGILDLTMTSPPRGPRQRQGIVSPSPNTKRFRHSTLPPSLSHKRKVTSATEPHPRQAMEATYERSKKRIRSQREQVNQLFQVMENEIEFLRLENSHEGHGVANRGSENLGISNDVDMPDVALGGRNARPRMPVEIQREVQLRHTIEEPVNRRVNATTAAPRPNVANPGAAVAAARPQIQAEAGNVQSPANRRKKTVYKSVAEQKIIKPEYPAVVPATGRASDLELIRIGKMRSTYGRHVAAPYAFTWSGTLRAAFTYLLARKDDEGNSAWTALEISRIRR